MIESITLKNTKTGKKFTADMKASKYLIEVVDFGAIQANHVTSKYFNQIGESEINTTLGTRAFQLIGWVVGSTQYELEMRKAFLNSFANPLQLITATVTRYDGAVFAIDISPDASIVYGKTSKENNNMFCKFSISGVCNDPLFRSNISNKVMMASTVPLFHFPLIIPKATGLVMSLKETTLIKSVYNSGSVDVGAVIEFSAKGSVLNPKITKIGTQEVFKINKTLIAGEKVIIDTSIGVKSATGFIYGKSIDYFQYVDLNSDWLVVSVGDNVFRYDADSNIGQLEVSISYYTKLLEME